jgi:hypothetical protein
LFGTGDKKSGGDLLDIKKNTDGAVAPTNFLALGHTAGILYFPL